MSVQWDIFRSIGPFKLSAIKIMAWHCSKKCNDHALLEVSTKKFHTLELMTFDHKIAVVGLKDDMASSQYANSFSSKQLQKRENSKAPKGAKII